jgi:dinuclear metal center YbgI/SA1388 family protein
MVSLKQLVNYCDQLLESDSYQDYCPNGLQIEGVAEVNKIVSGVTASQALIDAAVEQHADLLLVHHGFFWKSESPVITGIKKNRIKQLLDHDISLLTYHLPLDGHAELGNNAQLAKLWNVTVTQRFGHGPNGGIAMVAEMEEAMDIESFKQMISHSLGREVLHLEGGPGRVKHFAWCSGGAQDYLQQAAELDIDLFISGEVSESTYHLALEEGIHYLAAGHHATERLGVKALGEHLAQRFSIQHQYIDIDNPV